MPEYLPRDMGVIIMRVGGRFPVALSLFILSMEVAPP